MVTAILIVWILVGIGVVLFGIREKYKYGFVTQFNIESLIIVVVSALIWPLVIVLIVNFVRTQEEVIKKVLIDHPEYTREMLTRRTQRSNRHVPIICGIAYLIAAFLIYSKFSGWWTYIVGGTLLLLGYVSLKTGLFASQKEIKELTEPGPVSEETKKKFQDRL